MVQEFRPSPWILPFLVRRCFYLTSFTLVLLLRLYERYISSDCRQRPYHVESTGFRPITEVKQRRALLVPGWVTAWEHLVLLTSLFFFFFFFPPQISVAGVRRGCKYMMIFFLKGGGGGGVGREW